MDRVQVLREALPYITRFRGQTFLVKFGGEVADAAEHLHAFCEELALLAHVGIRLVVVHGGGRQADELSRRLGLEPRTINGRRITDQSTLDVVKMAFAGKLNTEILCALRKAGAAAVGLSGVDGRLITAVKRPAQRVVDARSGESVIVDFGYVGDISAVDTSVIETLQHRGFIPVIASLAADDDGNVYNVNADTIAAALGGALRASKLILATNVDGVLVNGQPLLRVTSGEIRKLISERVITGGMIPKVESAMAAIRAGVPAIHIINGLKRGSLLTEILTREGIGTMIVKE